MGITLALPYCIKLCLQCYSWLFKSGYAATYGLICGYACDYRRRPVFLLVVAIGSTMTAWSQLYFESFSGFERLVQ